MRKTRYDEEGFPILDEPLLSPKRLVYGCWYYADMKRHGCLKYPLWVFLRYYRRSYRAECAGYGDL